MQAGRTLISRRINWPYVSDYVLSVTLRTHSQTWCRAATCLQNFKRNLRPAPNSLEHLATVMAKVSTFSILLVKQVLTSHQIQSRVQTRRQMW
jgi:hypothetical protein